MALPKRKKMRLFDYDYSNSGCYFVTICTHNQENIFRTNGYLNCFGLIVDEEISAIRQRYDDVKIDNYIIMPNHLHLLVTIGCDALTDDEDTLLNEILGKNVHSDLNVIIGLFKSGVSKRIHHIKPALKVWQRSYFDHIVNNSREYDEMWDYIEANPIRWEIKYGEVIV